MTKPFRKSAYDSMSPEIRNVRLHRIHLQTEFF